MEFNNGVASDNDALESPSGNDSSSGSNNVISSLLAGNWAEAESLIVAGASLAEDDADSMTTPLNIVLGGDFTRKFKTLKRPRHLGLARLMVEHGADVNSRFYDRIHGVYTETPFSQLAQFHIKLLGLAQRLKSMGWSRKLSNDSMDCWEAQDVRYCYGFDGTTDITAANLVEETNELLQLFLAKGADVNLGTLLAGQTVFHAILATNPPADIALIEQMVRKNARINLTDSHGTTPFMDMISKCEDSHCISTFNRIKDLGKKIMLDVQNCSGEFALWRALFHGKVSTAKSLLQAGAQSSLSARVCRHYENTHDVPRVLLYFVGQNEISTLPAVLAPLLYDSPALEKLTMTQNPYFIPKYHNQIVREVLGPLIDQGYFCDEETAASIIDLMREHTKFGHLETVFPSHILIPLLFGDLTAGLIQAAVRNLFNTIFFGDKGKRLSVLLRKKDQIKMFKDHTTTLWTSEIPDLPVEECRYLDNNWVLQESPHYSSAAGNRTMSTGSDLPEPPNLIGFQICMPSLTPEDGQDYSEEETLFTFPNRRTGDAPSSVNFDLSSPASSFDPGTSADISGAEKTHLSSSWPPDSLKATASAKDPISHIDEVLSETSELLAHIQSEVDVVQKEEVEFLSNECQNFMQKIKPLLKASADDVQARQQQRSLFRNSESVPASNIKQVSPETKPEECSKESSEQPLSDIPHLVNDVPEWKENNNSALENGTSCFVEESGEVFCGVKLSYEAIVEVLSRDIVEELMKPIRLPRRFMPLFELEAARLQIILAVFKHNSVSCDRGCVFDEGDFHVDGSDDTESVNDFYNIDDYYESSASGEAEDDYWDSRSSNGSSDIVPEESSLAARVRRLDSTSSSTSGSIEQQRIDVPTWPWGSVTESNESNFTDTRSMPDDFGHSTTSDTGTSSSYIYVIRDLEVLAC